jgi:hypothetical protein
MERPSIAIDAFARHKYNGGLDEGLITSQHAAARLIVSAPPARALSA